MGHIFFLTDALTELVPLIIKAWHLNQLALVRGDILFLVSGSQASDQ